MSSRCVEVRPIELIPITPENYDLAKALSVRPDQERLVGSVQKSLADAYVYEESRFRIAFHEQTAVGYLFVFPYASGERHLVNIVRLMIDQHHQGRGLGRALLETGLAWIYTFSPAPDAVRISTLPENVGALTLYRSVGFKEDGIENGEIALYLES